MLEVRGLKKENLYGTDTRCSTRCGAFLVEEHKSRIILETINRVGKFDINPGQGIAIQIDVEDAVGVAHQVKEICKDIEDEI